MAFRSRTVELHCPTEWDLEGELTIRGVTRPITLRVRSFGQWQTPYWEDGVDRGPVLRAGFCATGSLDRRDFGVAWNGDLPGDGIVVGHEVFLTLDVEALRKQG